MTENRHEPETPPSGPAEKTTDDAAAVETEAILRYLQSDAHARGPLFAEFLSTLKRLAARGDGRAAADFARRAVSHKLDYSSLRKLGRMLDAFPGDGPRLRVALLGGPTLIQLADSLRVFLSAAGIDADIFHGEYRQFRMELLGPAPALDAFAPGLLVLALDAADVMNPFNPSWTREEMLAAARAEADGLAALWRRAKALWNCGVVQNLLDAEPWPVLGSLAFAHGVSRELYAAAINEAMRAHAADAGVAFHDLPSLVRNRGAEVWYDPRHYNESKLPCAPECLPRYAHGLGAVAAGLLGRSRKMLVLDLDNTLWGGVVGDAGPSGVAIGQGTGEGEAFDLFQRYVRDLAGSGVILGVCSKNDAANAKEPFAKNPGMVLKLDDFASFKANWRGKDENLREIAAEVNLGLDALVFVDDNPMERALVRRLLPEVAVPDMPEDPSYYARTLAEYRYFEKPSLTAEDAARSSHYAANRRRRELAETADSLDVFLASLRMRATFEPLGDANIERAVQLINKSNQFNLTGVKRELSAVRALAADPEWRTMAVSLRDNCGDNGLISVLLLRLDDGTLIVESWVMSCRVLQRGLENRILSELTELAGAAGCRRLEGRYVATAKNGMVKDLYGRLGFERAGDDGEVEVWRADADAPGLARRSHIH